MQLGAFLAAIGYEGLLIPNKIIDGGVIGISIIITYLTQVPLGLLITLLNIPFIFLGYKHFGKEFVISTLYSVISLSVWVTVLRSKMVFTNDLFLASIFGGIILGFGVGLIIRNGGSLDGTEIVGIIANKKISFSVGEIIMFINIFIFLIAALVYGFDRGMYSMVTYFVAYKLIDIVVEGIDDSKAIFIISPESETIRQSLIENFNRGLTIFNGRGGFSNDDRDIIYFIIRRTELYRLKRIVHEIDKNAFLSIQDLNEVFGKNIDNWKKGKAK